MPHALSVLNPAPASACDGGSLMQPPPRPAGFDHEPRTLVDGLGRVIRYVRFSVTDRCDLACVYCMPPEGEREHERRSGLLDFDEIARLSALLSRSGVERMRFTGGEPLVRRGVCELVAKVHARAPSLDLALTTNAMRLAELALPLKQAGLSSVNVSVDTLDPLRFAAVTRGGDLPTVLRGVQAALEVGLEVKINAVVLGAASLEEIPRLVDWAWSLGIVPRFIELMPIGEASRLSSEAFVPARAIAQALARHVHGDVPSAPMPNLGPARYHTARDGSGRKVGLITATTEPFCGTCNRIRITTRGELRGCLGSPVGVSLREVMRASPSDLDLAWALHAALRSKVPEHGFQDQRPGVHAQVGMSLIGG